MQNPAKWQMKSGRVRQSACVLNNFCDPLNYEPDMAMLTVYNTSVPFND